MNAALELLLDVGVPVIAAHARAITAPLRDAASQGAVRITSPGDRPRSALVCVRSRRDTARGHARLVAAGVSCSLREGSIRLAPHLFNTEDELAMVADLLADAAR
mgnify:FL=1